jgi:hypothetical protein
MPFKRGDREDTFANVPTRRFLFVIDAESLVKLVVQPYRGVSALIGELAAAPNGVSIQLMFPAYLDPASPQRVPGLIQDYVTTIAELPDTRRLPLSERLPSTVRDSLRADDSDGHKAMELLSLAGEVQADGIVTASKRLLEARYPLYQHHRARIIPVNEFGRLVEVCGHGHNFFWSSTGTLRHLDQDLYYQLTHPKARRLAEWYSTIVVSLEPHEHRENLRVALLNRYPFVLYSRDMVRFYELQMDYFARRDLPGRFGTTLGYYITNFYLHVWGLLEQLTIVAKYQRELRLEEANCGIHNDRRFWKTLGPIEPGLRSFVKGDPIAGWIAALADIRHAAAHRAMILPRTLMEETPTSQLTEDEVRVRLRAEDPEFYTKIPPEFLATLEPMRINQWRLAQYRTVGENVIVVKGRSGTWIRGAAGSIDYDLEMLDAVIDAFLVALFRRRQDDRTPAMLLNHT